MATDLLAVSSDNLPNSLEKKSVQETEVEN